MLKREFMLALAVLSLALPASAADLLATVKARGTLKVALEGTYPPFNYKEKNGELAGYDVDVAKLLGSRLGLKVEFVSSEWASILAGLASNKYDVIVSQVGINPKREQAFDFSTPYIYSMPQLIVRNNETAVYKSLADLKGKKLGVGQGSVYEQQAKAVPGIEIRSYAAAPETMSDLASGRIDAALNDSLMSAYLLKISKLPIKAGAQVGAVERMGIPFKKGNPEFKQALNKALADAAADGSLKAISLKWFGTDVSKAP
ncbi:transporter substrate-binding domain-containing protein [Pseudoduganella sp. FT26W]|uniref:Transporter substrate-binding domain-containing protein n=1 Tax=Duganella aquatilis TaxID=2666082 RepID=A0A844DD49_9BURK|nr:transporter substrate-binding domain-containing protein [Duganella aquatilis]MRW85880.1 transporter substrate-binding domain-containing protein [Duganella aquatilis]